MEIGDKLALSHELLSRAQQSPEGERLWLLTLAWAELQEVATALECAARTDLPAAKGDLSLILTKLGDYKA